MTAIPRARNLRKIPSEAGSFTNCLNSPVSELDLRGTICRDESLENDHAYIVIERIDADTYRVTGENLAPISITIPLSPRDNQLSHCNPNHSFDIESWARESVHIATAITYQKLRFRRYSKGGALTDCCEVIDAKVLPRGHARIAARIADRESCWRDTGSRIY